jgi:dihydrofolate reductase
MRKLTVNTFISLDGVMQAPGGPEEDPTGGFEHGGWSVSYWDDLMGEVMDAAALPSELLLGRGTYEIFAAHWPHVSGDPMADALNSARKHVASTTLDEVTWNNSTLIDGDVAEYVRKLKEEDGPEIQVHGSAGLLQTLLEHDLVDRFQLMIFPLVIGTGKPLFGDGAIPAGLKLVDSKVSTTGVLIATYERAGDIETGSFALDEPTEAELDRRQGLR